MRIYSQPSVVDQSKKVTEKQAVEDWPTDGRVAGAWRHFVRTMTLAKSLKKSDNLSAQYKALTPAEKVVHVR